MRLSRLTAAWTLTLAAALAVSQATCAGAADGYVTAESRYGPRTISAPVRQTGLHRYEVRLPGGTWVDCHLSCSNALRRETIDFWENHDGRPLGGGSDGPGYFRWIW